MPELPLRSHAEGVVVEVWAKPGSSHPGIGGMHDRALEVRVAAPADAGRANQAVADAVAGLLGGRRAQVIAGLKARRKQVLVRGVTFEEARRRLLPPEGETAG